MHFFPGIVNVGKFLSLNIKLKKNIPPNNKPTPNNFYTGRKMLKIATLL